MSVRQFYKFKDKKVYYDYIKKIGSQTKVANLTGICINTISKYASNDCAIIKSNAITFAKVMEKDFDKLFIEVNVKANSTYKQREDRDKTDFQISEEIIMGLKKNIQDRLEITHTRPYVNDIMKVIDELVIESSYLGVNSALAKKHAFIVKAITSRRNK